MLRRSPHQNGKPKKGLPSSLIAKRRRKKKQQTDFPQEHAIPPAASANMGHLPPTPINPTTNTMSASHGPSNGHVIGHTEGAKHGHDPVSPFRPSLHGYHQGLHHERSPQEVQKIKGEISDEEQRLALALKKDQHYQDKIDDLDGRIDQARDEQDDHRLARNEGRKPSRDRIEAPANTWIAGMLSFAGLALLTIYYIELGYMAFLDRFNLSESDKTFAFGQDADEVSVFNSIFKGDALERLLSGDDSGVLGIMFVILFPVFIFLSAWAIHEIRKIVDYEERRRKLLAAVAFVAFADALLAYRVVKAVYEANKSLLLEESTWTMWQGLFSGEFWLLLCIGFVGHLLFSIVLSGFLSRLNERDPIRRLNAVVDSLRKRRAEVVAEKRKNELVIAQYRHRIKFLNDALVGLVLRKSYVYAELTKFYQGYIAFVEGQGVDVKARVQAITSQFNAYLKEIEPQFT